MNMGLEKHFFVFFGVELCSFSSHGTSSLALMGI